MNRFAVLLRTPAVAPVEFDHPEGAEHCDPDHEVSVQESISFVEDGTFDAHMDDERWTLGPGTLFLTRPGMAFRCRHGDHAPRVDGQLTSRKAPP